MHSSADGFVAGPNKEMNWIHVDDEIFDYAGNQTDEADTALYGRVTYQMMEAYWPTAADKPSASKHDIHHSRWYNNVEKVVLSRTMKGANLKKTTIISENIAEEINKLKQKNGKNIVIFGSPGAGHSLMKENLIDEFWIFVNPIILGHGIALSTEMKEKIKLKLLSCKVFTSGVMGLQYEKIK